ncbi:MaoC/PaaZ C-terminal domain-containing protein [Pseudomonas sp. LS44]|uniref:MaoC/PaaZ C-terminal domain-containing protein n=1 Tax=Pseudomonas sp. LS44 TaxID=1357074 RepID=UPI00215AB8D4|nr:MaoC/PaaZ C-terminal domain-containing protein [Pseudomonas sp. LS44]UVE16008.1 MaoC/PaaZ C-terminal domain-containing protein [Pseudomonas sp. LS44]
MSIPKYSDVQVGDELSLMKLRPVDRTMLALYAGASGDHNQVHIDTDFARKARQPDVFAQGMLSVAYLGRLLTAWVPQPRIRNLSVRFVGITWIGHIPHLTGRITEKFEEGGEQRVRLEIQCVNQHGEPKLVGDAVVALA